MNKALKAKWVEALRSGRYRQGWGTLVRKTPDGEEFCCLGVLCEIAKLPFDLGNYSQFDTVLGHTLPLNQFINRNDGNGEFRGNAQTFAQIADYIEANI